MSSNKISTLKEEIVDLFCHGAPADPDYINFPSPDEVKPYYQSLIAFGGDESHLQELLSEQLDFDLENRFVDIASKALSQLGFEVKVSLEVKKKEGT